MSLTLADLKSNPKIPSKEIYIDALEDSIEVQPISSARVNEIREKEGDPKSLAVLIIAESLSKETGMSLEDASVLHKEVKAGMHPAAYDEICLKIMELQVGKQRMPGMAID